MKKYAFINPNGDAAYTASPATDDTYIDGEIYNGLMCREIPQIADDTEVIERWYWVGDDHFVRPPRPTDFHDWSGVTKSWLPNLPAAISARKAEIDVERDRRISLPLLYDGKNLDADARARENLKSKLEEIKSREALNQPIPQQMMVWRDADNVTHSWPTQEAYKAWLEGFAVSMSERGTMIYAACWAHKGNIGALTSVEDVLNYDATIGWPS